MARISRKKDLTSEEEYRTTPMYIILTCGLIIILIGIYLSISNKIAFGLSLPNRYSGDGGGNQIFVNGPFAIFIGICFVYFLLINYLKKEKRSNNFMSQRGLYCKALCAAGDLAIVLHQRQKYIN